MHFHLPSWVYKALAAIGGVGFLAQQVAKPLLLLLIERYQVEHDQPVWEVVREPKYKPIYSQMNVTTYDPQVELPYTVAEIAKRADRKESSVLRSLKRLEKRSKVKDVHGGWKRT